jgi:hypothetical protein
VNKYVKGPPDRSGVLKPGYASLADFDTRVNAVIASYLGSSNGPVVGLALTQIATVVAASPSDAVAKSGIVTAMNSYYGQNFSKLNAENKKSIAAFYLDIVARSDLARNETLTALNKTVTNAGRQVPLWATLRDDVTIGALANAVPVQSSATSDLTFLAQVAARAGASGNNSALARQATDKIASMKEIGAFTPEGRVVLRNAANGATLPTVANRLDAILRPSTE